MKLYYFSEKYRSLRLELPNRFFDRERAAANYQRSIELMGAKVIPAMAGL